MAYFETEITVLGGLPVYCIASISGPDRDVGIFNSYMDDYQLFWNSKKFAHGKEVPDSIYDRIEKARNERDLIEEQVLEHLNARECY